MCPPVGGHIDPDEQRAIKMHWNKMHLRHINRMETDTQSALLIRGVMHA